MKDDVTGVDLVDFKSLNKLRETTNNLKKAGIMGGEQEKIITGRLQKSYEVLSTTKEGRKQITKQLDKSSKVLEDLIASMGATGATKLLGVRSLMFASSAKRAIKFMLDKTGEKVNPEKITAMADFAIQPEKLIPYFEKFGKDISQRQARRAADAYFSGVKISEFNSEKDNGDK